MRAELRSLFSIDGDRLEDLVPDFPDDFAISVRAIIGPAGSPGEESFDFTVCTAKWLVANPPEKGFAFLHSHLLVTHWDFDLVTRAVADLCLRTEGEDWNEIGTSLSRSGYWEFDSYRE